MGDMSKVSQFRLKNEGGFICDIHAVYFDHNGVQLEAKNGDNIPIGQTSTMNLAEKCPGIYTGSIVLMKVWVMWGDDNTYRQGFLFDPEGPIQAFKIAGGVRNNALEWLGPV